MIPVKKIVLSSLGCAFISDVQQQKKMKARKQTKAKGRGKRAVRRKGR